MRRATSTSPLHKFHKCLLVRTSQYPTLRAPLQLRWTGSTSQSIVTPLTQRQTANRAIISEDPALQWARSNPSVAQACLNVPPFSLVIPTPTKEFQETGCRSRDDDANDDAQLPLWLFRDWSDYLERRIWAFAVPSTELPHAEALVSHVLTGPLTLYTALWQQNAMPVPLASNTETTAAGTLHLCCVGARSEAMLPIEYWTELLDLCRASKSVHAHVTIDFCGADMDARRADVTIARGSSLLTLRWVYTGKYHDHVQHSRPVPRYHGHLLFNPGVGHAHLQNDWKPTLDLLLASSQDSAPFLLLTAHSEVDAARDAAFLKQHYQLDTAYVRNPFASRISYHDPLQPDHIVRPNDYVALITPSARQRPR